MFESETFEVIKKRMLDRVPSYLDKGQTSVCYNTIVPIAAELAQMKIDNDTIIKETFANTSDREYLIKRAGESGFTPTEATYAVMQGEFKNADGLVDITIGSRFTCGSLVYKAIEKISTGKYKMQCETKGTEGNLNTGICIPVEYIEGLASANITSILIPAEDEEDTEIFRDRYLGGFESKAYGGNRADYIANVNKINGVGKCKAERITTESDPILITIIDSNYDKPSSALVELVQNTIDPNKDKNGDGIAPYNHIVTIQGVTEKTIKIYIDAEYDEGYSFSSLKTLIENKIKAYLLSLRQTWHSETNLIVRHTMMTSEILKVEGIIDINTLKINGVEGNSTLTKYEIPVFNEVVDE